VFSSLFRRSRTNIILREPTFGMNCRNQALRLQREAQVYYFVFKHPRVRWYAKLVAACSAGYLFSPIQLIPSYIPVIGFLDDFLVLYVGTKLLQRIIPLQVLAECRQLAEAAEMRRKEEIRSTPAVVAFVVIAAVWLIAAASASILMARYISANTAIAK
jgi:uncharacterized membrane protein YkvA (DUF1232 family)